MIINIKKRVKSSLRPFITLLRLWVKEHRLKKKAVLPVVINFNANDICNSKCTMCNIWKQKQDIEIQPSEFEKLLTNPLYKNVKHIGITGGEPTLREDISQLYSAAIKALPNIHGLSIITNAINNKDVIERVEQVRAVCADNDKGFSIMVSLDGVGEVHDRVRGREGNFNSAIKVIEYFKSKGVEITTGTTISKVNVWDIEDLLYFFKKKGWYGRFRVAEFINRLYNENRAEVIRNFDDDEKYQLCLFFYKLIHSYETNPDYQRTYKSIISILSGGKRLIGCPYHADGVVVNSKGELAYCAPKSQIIGNGLNGDSRKIFFNNLHERKRIKKEDCASCIHDYHAPITYNEKLNEYKVIFWKKSLSLDSRIAEKICYFISSSNAPFKEKQVFIVGWYGTETVGDKAILGGIVMDLEKRYGSFSLVIGSLYPFVTKRTVQELGLNAQVVPVYGPELIRYSKDSDIIIMGGGPLMDLEELSIPLHAFRIGKLYKRTTIVYGCGLGPLTEDRYKNAVKEILNLSSDILLRDNKSIELARAWINKDINISHLGDPAKIYLNKYKNTSIEVKSDRKVIRCFLREWTYEYSKDIGWKEFLDLKKKFEEALAAYILKKAEELKVIEVVFEHMNNFVIGNDDRDFSRYFIDTYMQGASVKVNYNKYLSTVDSIVCAMKNSEYNICMRFHSVLFAHSLNTPFTAIDYTKGGKIFNYLKDNQAEEYLMSISELVNNYR